MSIFNNSEKEWCDGWFKADAIHPEDLIVVEILYSEKEDYKATNQFNNLVYGAGMYNSMADIWYRLAMPEIGGELTPTAESGVKVIYWRGGNL